MFFNVRGIKKMIIKVLKIIVLRIVELGECRYMMFSVFNCGYVVVNVVGIMVKYFVILLVMLKVVSELWVISICLLMCIILINLVGLELRLIILFVFFVVWVLEFIVIVIFVCVSVGVLLVLLLVIVIK